MLRSLGERAEAWARATNPWTNVYGLARSLLALSSASTLLFSPTGALFRPLVSRADYPYCDGLSGLSFYCAPGLGGIEVRQWIAFFVLLVVASGWRPRWTAPVHWWVSISFLASGTMVDGGDQVVSILSLQNQPVALLDRRRWHWTLAPSGDADPRIFRRLVALSSLVAIRFQVAGIYFHAFLGKFGVTEWVDGTVLYYWTQHPNFGAPGWLDPVVTALVTHPIGVVTMTWSSMLLEVFLFTGLVMDKRGWNLLLWLGLGFHGAIALIHGLGSFSIAMSAALILYLRPCSKPFRLSASIKTRLKGPLSY